MRTRILGSVLFTFLSLAHPAPSQESRPQRPSTPPSPAEVLELLSGHWKCSAVKQPSWEALSFCDYVVNEVLPGGRWFCSFTGVDGPAKMSWWEFRAFELIPNTSSVSGVIVHGSLREVRLLHGSIQGRHLVVNELSGRRTYTTDGDLLKVDIERVDSTGRRSTVVDEKGVPTESAHVEKLVRAKRPRNLFESAGQVTPPRNKLDEKLRELVGSWKPVGEKDLLNGTRVSRSSAENTLLPGGWVASVSGLPPDIVGITLIGVDPAGHAVVGVDLEPSRATAALVSGYLENDRLVTGISGIETVWKVEGSRMTQTSRVMVDGSGRDLSVLEFAKE